MIALRVAKTHKIEYAEPKLWGRVDVQSFIDRLRQYLHDNDRELCEVANTGEWADYEAYRVSLERVVENLRFETDEQTVSDIEVIQQLIDESDQSDDWVHIYVF